MSHSLIHSPGSLESRPVFCLPPLDLSPKSRVAYQAVMDSPPDGVFRFELGEVDNFDAPKVWKYSPEVEVKGVPWEANVSLSAGTVDARLECNLDQQLAERRKEGTFWDVTDAGDQRSQPGVGLLIGKTLILARYIPRFDFTDPNDARHDIALIMEGEKIHAGKQVLALHSPVFNEMFFGDLAEKNKKEFELNDVDRKEFILLLEVIYPSNKKFKSGVSPEFLLQLCDRFQIESVVKRVEEFLINSWRLPNKEKLRIADHYKLFALKDHCISQLETVKDYDDIKESPMYENLSEDTKTAISDRQSRICKPNPKPFFSSSDSDE